VIPDRPRGPSDSGEVRDQGPTVRRWVETVEDVPSTPKRSRKRDTLATEEPLEIRVVQAGRAEPIAITMRTPGHDFQLAAGFLFTEGVLEHAAQVAALRYCVGERTGQLSYNVVNVELAPGVCIDPARPGRGFAATSSCGVCGKRSIEAIADAGVVRSAPGPLVGASTLVELSRTLAKRQKIFARTGGLHAAGLFTPDGALLALYEDVGRHNALDKLIGQIWLANQIPLVDRIVLLSGRLSFEILQKAARAGITFVAGVSAPSSLAVRLAERFDITLVGFLRGGRFNIYHGRERIEGLPEPAWRRG
jgi:FdhD protein